MSGLAIQQTPIPEVLQYQEQIVNYTPPGPFDTVGSFYYYVVISDDAAGCFDCTKWCVYY